VNEIVHFVHNTRLNDNKPDFDRDVLGPLRAAQAAKAAAEQAAKDAQEAADKAQRDRAAQLAAAPVASAPAAPSASVADTVALGKTIAEARGWGDQWNELYQLLNHESGWTVGKMNLEGSGACGIGQALPCSKLGAGYGNAAAEISWAYDYIAARYTTPARAWAYWNCIGLCTNNYGTIEKFNTWY